MKNNNDPELTTGALIEKEIWDIPEISLDSIYANAIPVQYTFYYKNRPFGSRSETLNGYIIKVIPPGERMWAVRAFAIAKALNKGFYEIGKITKPANEYRMLVFIPSKSYIILTTQTQMAKSKVKRLENES